jgi:hypothetical protein
MKAKDKIDFSMLVPGKEYRMHCSLGQVIVKQESAGSRRFEIVEGYLRTRQNKFSKGQTVPIPDYMECKFYELEDLSA